MARDRVTDTSAAETSVLRAHYKALLESILRPDRNPQFGIELVAETCHGGDFCHGGTNRTITPQELVEFDARLAKK